MILLLFPFVLFFSFVLFMSNDSFNIFVKRIFGAEVIVVRKNSHLTCDLWKGVLYTDAWGSKYSYRYPTTKIGYVKLNDDGTGEYCGVIEWKMVQ